MLKHSKSRLMCSLRMICLDVSFEFDLFSSSIDSMKNKNEIEEVKYRTNRLSIHIDYFFEREST